MYSICVLLNIFVKTKENIYDLLREKRHYYLPDLQSQCVAHGYLLAYAKKVILTVAYEEVKWLMGQLLQKRTKDELVDTLSFSSEQEAPFREPKATK